MWGSMGIQGKGMLMCCTFSSEKLASSRSFCIALVRQHPSKMSFQVGAIVCCLFLSITLARVSGCRSDCARSRGPGCRRRRPWNRWAPGAG
ncbi:hypothetical protein N320_04823, partial [Buceros rhinoceros silvestris]